VKAASVTQRKATSAAKRTLFICTASPKTKIKPTYQYSVQSLGTCSLVFVCNGGFWAELCFVVSDGMSSDRPSNYHRQPPGYGGHQGQHRPRSDHYSHSSRGRGGGGHHSPSYHRRGGGGDSGGSHHSSSASSSSTSNPTIPSSASYRYNSAHHTPRDPSNPHALVKQFLADTVAAQDEARRTGTAQQPLLHPQLIGTFGWKETDDPPHHVLLGGASITATSASAAASTTSSSASSTSATSTSTTSSSAPPPARLLPPPLSAATSAAQLLSHIDSRLELPGRPPLLRLPLPREVVLPQLTPLQMVHTPAPVFNRPPVRQGRVAAAAGWVGFGLFFLQ
jgi:hypothetical protein